MAFVLVVGFGEWDDQDGPELAVRELDGDGPDDEFAPVAHHTMAGVTSFSAMQPPGVHFPPPRPILVAFRAWQFTDDLGHRLEPPGPVSLWGPGPADLRAGSSFP
jgi:hypothetical protein